MSGLIMAGQLILALSFLVVIHEFGHFIAARALGIRVEKFFIFFDAGYKIWSKKFGDTEFGIGWLPLGGYVKISGMIDESLDSKQLSSEPKEWEFRSKPAWQKLIVMIGGVVMNVIAAILILTFIHLNYTKEYVPVENIEGGIYAYEYGRELGFETGDKILAIDGEKLVRAEDIFSSKLFFAKEILVDRNNQEILINIPDSIFSYLKNGGLIFGLDNYKFSVNTVLEDGNADKAGMKEGAKIIAINNININSFGQFKEILAENKNNTLDIITDNRISYDTLKVKVDSLGKIGIGIEGPQYLTKDYTLTSAMKYGCKDSWEALYSNIQGFKLIFSGKEKAKDNLAGPIGIAKVYGGEWNWPKFWNITAILSMVLALVNILPIPALDGGHVFILSIEAITRKTLPDKVMEVIQIIGMIIIFALMIFIIGNDIINLF